MSSEATAENNTAMQNVTVELDEKGEAPSSSTHVDEPDWKKRTPSLRLAPRSSLLLSRKKPEVAEQPPTSYIETIVHLLKGNIGPGLFAMGDAFKNGGLIVSPVLLLVIAIIAVHCQHILINCSERVRILRGDTECTDYADTVELCFLVGPPRFRKMANPMRLMVNFFICVTQFGFCCIYFVFISFNVQQIFKANGIYVNVHLVMLAFFVPVLLTSLITSLKFLTPVSLFANICMFTGLVTTLYFALKDGLPDPSIRNMYTNGPQLALFFGTAIFAFEGIALVLPLKNAMGNPADFDRKFGVLNVGMTIVATLFMTAGLVGYINWGEDIGGSLTLNIGDTVFAQVVKMTVATGVLLGYPLQFFIPIQIMWPETMVLLHLQNNPFIGELGFRTTMVIVTLIIAELVPALGLFISLIGSLCSTSLALVFPSIIELLLKTHGKAHTVFIFSKNILILCLAILGFTTGTYESISGIVKYFRTSHD